MRDTSRKGMAVISVLVALLSLGAHAGVYSGGTGTAGDPYQIGTVEDWNILSFTPVDWDKYFILTMDIDFAGAALTPIGNNIVPFTGEFDGNSHLVLNGRINLRDQNDVGLFGCLGVAGTIRNLGARAVNVTGAEYVGGLVGNSSGTITSCHTTGNVKANYYAGGLAGYSSGTVTLCYATGSVTGISIVGGLFGINQAGPVIACYARGTVAGDYAGGLIGQNNGAVNSCYATGEVTRRGGNTGGLVAWERGGAVGSCYWDMDTSGQSASGSGEGRMTTEMTYPYPTNTYVLWDFVSIWAEDVDHSLNDGYPYLLGNMPAPEEEACGCCRATAKNLSLKDLVKKYSGDWMLVGLSVLVLAVFSNTRYIDRHN